MKRSLAATLVVACMSASSASVLAASQTRSVQVITDLVDASEEGATVLVPAGVYVGSLRVKRPVILEGAGEVVIDGEGTGTVVELLAPGITFRGFTVRNSSASVSGEPAGIRAGAGQAVIENNIVTDALFGIDLQTSSDSIVRNNDVTGKDLSPGRRGDGIRLWWSHNCVVEGNHIRGARDMVFWYSENLRVRRNIVDDSRYGLHFMYSHDTVLEENVLTGNAVGVYLMYSNDITLVDNTLAQNRGSSGYGLGLKDCDNIVVTGNRLMANRVGLYIDNSPSSVDATGLISGNTIAFNEIGLIATPNTHDNFIIENAFVENEEQGAVHGRGALTLNHFTRDGRGNFWSDYAGFDFDNDGIGDVAYESRSLFENLLAREPNLRLFVHSPAQQAVEFAARTLPELRPDPKFVDASPLYSNPIRDLDVPNSAIAWPLGALSFVLLGGAGVATWFGARGPSLAAQQSPSDSATEQS